MTVKPMLAVIAITALLDRCVATENSDVTVWGYIPEYRMNGIDFEAISPYLTHTILFSIEVAADGSLAALDRVPNPVSMGNIRRITDEHNTKLLFSLGGFGRSNGFATVATNPKLRKKFAKNLMRFVLKYDLDGIDYNWEYPQSEKEWIGLFELLTATRKLMNKIEKRSEKKRKYELSMAFYPGQESLFCHQFAAKYNLLTTIDYIHIMTYDNMRTKPAKHSTFEFADKSLSNVLSFNENCENIGAKLTLGVPFYGRDMESGDAKTYEEIVREMGNDFDTSLDEFNGFYYNGIDTIQQKTQLAMDRHIGGVMIWEVGQDVNPKDKPNLSLLKAIHDTIHTQSEDDTPKSEL